MFSDTIIGIMFFISFVSGIIMLVGIVMLFAQSAETKKTARKLLVGGFISMILTFIIGFSVCTATFKIGAMH